MIDHSYIEEIRLSRELARAIEETLHQYGKVVPHSVLLAYNRLLEFYNRQQEDNVA